MDARIIKTKNKIKHGVMKLFFSGVDLSRYEIKKFTKENKINRATFYHHYYNFDDVIKDILNDIKVELNNLKTKLDSKQITQKEFNKGVKKLLSTNNFVIAKTQSRFSWMMETPYWMRMIIWRC